MPLVIPTNFAQITLLFGGDALDFGAATTFGIKYSDSLFTTPFEVANAVEGALEDAVLNDLWNENVRLLTTRCKFGPTATGPVGEVTVAIDGNQSGDAGNPATCVLLKKITTLGGRKNRGRMYMPTCGETPVGFGGELTDAYVSSRQGAVSDFVDKLAIADLPMYILHSSALAPTIVEAVVIESVVATQRHRLRR